MSDKFLCRHRIQLRRDNDSWSSHWPSIRPSSRESERLTKSSASGRTQTLNILQETLLTQDCRWLFEEKLQGFSASRLWQSYKSLKPGLESWQFLRSGSFQVFSHVGISGDPFSMFGTHCQRIKNAVKRRAATASTVQAALTGQIRKRRHGGEKVP